MAYQQVRQLTVTSTLRDHFLLDPDVIFLNHGSFGAVPKPVYEAQQQWRERIERQPIQFFQCEFHEHMNHARGYLADYLQTQADNLVFMPNATTALNMVIKSLELQAGDEILTSNHEYGALELTWEFVRRKTGITIVPHPIKLPLTTPEEFVEDFWASVTPKTSVIFLSHITSPTALILPLEEICRQAREAGILTVIDGAHAPGQIPLDVSAIGADFYAGNCHKWLCSARHAGFLYARLEMQHLLDPLVISWGWVEENTFAMQNQWQGTRDVTGYLSVPTAIEFQREHNWSDVQARCHQMAQETLTRLCDWSGLSPLLMTDDWYAQMVAIPLPDCDVDALKSRLYDAYRVEAPILRHQNQVYIRVSYQAYNSRDDMEAVIHAIQEIFS